jgi:hypothetical protein
VRDAAAQPYFTGAVVVPGADRLVEDVRVVATKPAHFLTQANVHAGHQVPVALVPQIVAVREAGRSSGMAWSSANSESDVDRDEHIDRRGSKASRLEPPLGHGRHGFPIEALGVERAHDTDLRRRSVARDDGFQQDRALNLVVIASLLYLGLTSLIRRGAVTAPPGR